MSVTLLGTKETTVNKTEKTSAVLKLTLYWDAVNSTSTLMNLSDGSILETNTAG